MRLSYLTSCIFVLSLTACGGGSDRESASESCVFVSSTETCNNIDDNCDGRIDEGFSGEPISVVSVSPAEDASSIAKDAAIVVEFSGDVNPDTVSAQSFSVNGGRSKGEYKVEGNKVTFTPTTPWGIGANPEVKLPQGAVSIKSPSCGLLAAEKTWRFSVPDGQWTQTPLLMHRSTSRAPRVFARIYQNDLSVIWEEHPDNINDPPSIREAHFRNNAWKYRIVEEAPTPFSGYPANILSSLTVGDSGPAGFFASYLYEDRYGDMEELMRLARKKPEMQSDPLSRWFIPQTGLPIEGNSNAKIPYVVGSKNGSALLYWLERVEAGAQAILEIRSIYFDFATEKWATTNLPNVLDKPVDWGNRGAERAAFNDIGQAILVWTEPPTTNNSLIPMRARRFANGQWDAAVTNVGMLARDFSFQPAHFDVAVDNSGRAIVVFVNETGKIVSTELNLTDTVWSQPNTVNVGPDVLAFSTSFAFAMNGDGNAVVAFKEVGSSPTEPNTGVYASFFNGETWQTTEKIRQDDPLLAPQNLCGAGIDEYGNVFTAWADGTENKTLTLARLPRDNQTWSINKLVDAQTKIEYCSLWTSRSGQVTIFVDNISSYDEYIAEGSVMFFR